ncbi:tRNA lysidine(34) synthetase [Sphingomonas sp. 28-62-11]|uniref:tRNA lysidine(34) synthetase TilS n=1 Tax=Sphingomonas sp. 28-62-11 TaxID=1970432 RepID=UPI000BCEB447|nr:MAG: tRNA lysidine(34) synthetase TilS [Sphingomonas sp. 28-62-11]
MTALPDPGLIARFRGDVEAALGRSISPVEKIALAVSGGPDSMAMLALAAAAFPGQVTAATVDHGLRPASAGEAALVADYCARIGVAHATLSIAEPRDPRDNLHDWARGQRYALLKRWAVGQGARILATAHHADDQAETFLMRAARGSGVAGLAGIRAHLRQEVSFPVGDTGLVFDVFPIDLIRPLLGWRVAELRAIAVAGAIPFVDDPSNADDRFDRTAFRALLRDTDLLDPHHIARSASHAAEADAALRAMERWLWDTRKVTPTGVDDPDDQSWLDMAGLPRELKRRLARSAIDSVRTVSGITRPDFSDATNIESLLDALDGGKSATQAGILVVPKGTIWRFSEAPPRRSL